MPTVVHAGKVAKLLQGSRVHFNLHTAALVEHAVSRGEVKLTRQGAVVGYTAPRTGRSPKDKFIVRDAITTDKVDWGTVNQAVEAEVFDALYDGSPTSCRAGNYLSRICIVERTLRTAFPSGSSINMPGTAYSSASCSSAPPPSS